MSGGLKIVIRHAERQPIQHGDEGSSALLTAAGHAAAETLGKILPRNRSCALWSSPIERCLQTARGIGKYAPPGTPEPVVEEYLCRGFVRDYEMARGDLLERGYEPVLTDYIKNGSYKGFWPREEGLRILEDFVASRGEDQTALFITHDAVLAPLMAWRCGAVVNRDNWIGFLQGACRFPDGHWELWPG